MKTENGGELPVVMRLAGFASRALPGSLKQGIYRSPFLSRLVRRSLNLSAPSGLTDVVVAGGALRGARLKLDLGSEKYYWLGTYEPQLVQAIQDFCRPDMTVYDVGANIGYASLAFARVVGGSGQVYAFEPLPANVERLRGHVDRNGLRSVVRVVPQAASDREGEEAFLVHRLHAMGKLAGSSGRGQQLSRPDPSEQPAPG